MAPSMRHLLLAAALATGSALPRRPDNLRQIGIELEHLEDDSEQGVGETMCSTVKHARLHAHVTARASSKRWQGALTFGSVAVEVELNDNLQFVPEADWVVPPPGWAVTRVGCGEAHDVTPAEECRGRSVVWKLRPNGTVPLRRASEWPFSAKQAPHPGTAEFAVLRLKLKVPGYCWTEHTYAYINERQAFKFISSVFGNGRRATAACTPVKLRAERIFHFTVIPPVGALGAVSVDVDHTDSHFVATHPGKHPVSFSGPGDHADWVKNYGIMRTLDTDVASDQRRFAVKTTEFSGPGGAMNGWLRVLFRIPGYCKQMAHIHWYGGWGTITQNHGELATSTHEYTPIGPDVVFYLEDQQ